MAILIADTKLETETDAWYQFYVDKMSDIADLPTSQSTGASYKVKKLARPTSIAYCIEMAAVYALDGADQWRLMYALREDVANTSASEQAAANSASSAEASRIAANKSEKISAECASSASANERASRDSAAEARAAEGNTLNYMNRTLDIANQAAGSASSTNFAFGPDADG